MGVVATVGLNLFRRDKVNYIYDLTAQSTELLAANIEQNLRQLASPLVGSAERLHRANRLGQLDEEGERLFQYRADLYRFAIRKNGQLLFSVANPDGGGVTSGWDKQTGGPVTKELEQQIDAVGLSVVAIRPTSLVANCLILIRDATHDTTVIAEIPMSDVIDTTEKRLYQVIVSDFRGELFATQEGQALTADSKRAVLNAAQQLKKINSGADVTTLEYRDDRSDWLASYTTVSIGGLGLMIRIPKDQAFLATAQLVRVLWGYVALILLAACLFAYGLARSLTRPIKILARYAARVGQGHFAEQVLIRAGDELGSLAGAFNEMGQALQRRDHEIAEASQRLTQSEKMSAFGQMSAGIAHEVKNPLAVILGFAQLSRQRLPEDSPLRKFQDNIEREAKRCKEIIDNLMKFARQEKAEQSEIELNQVVRDTITLVSHQLAINKVKVEPNLHADDKATRILGNANQLQQVLMNLMINAQHAMPNGGVEWLTTVVDSGGNPTVIVKDNGTGIPKEHQQKIFEPFFTTKDVGKGTGLGLSVSLGIVRDHGGKIDLESEVGVGSAFTLSFPAADQRCSQTSASEGKSTAQPLVDRSALPQPAAD